MAEEEVRSDSVVLRFDAKRCIHARHCVLGRPDVFVPNVEGEWLHPERATADEIAELAHTCPSGAVTYERLDGGSPESAPRVNTVRVRENGPLAFHGPLVIVGQPAGTRATLCRCGASQNKPYCDGSHSAAGFTATGEPSSRDSAALAERDGPLTLSPLEDGPLKIEGNLEVISGTGRTTNRTNTAFFCRCGHSSKKPYCDGTHAKVGWKSA